MVDKECLDCRHHKNGGCDTWCESGEAWTPLKKNEYKKIVHAKWIPCDERMPNENGWYQCSCYDPNLWSGDGIVRNLYWNSGFGEFIDNIRFEANDFKDRERFYWTKYVVAWMPLPKPYRKECDNNETD
jgi:hypothetical protein